MRSCSDGVHSCRSSKSRWLPTTAGSCGDLRFGAQTRATRGSCSPGATSRPSPRARLTIARPIGCSERDSSAAATDSTPCVDTPSTPKHVGDRHAAVRQRPGLVEGDAADRAEPLEMRAALDEHALARGRRQRRDDRDRRRDHERARTGDDQQRQRAIDPDGKRGARCRRASSGGTTAAITRERRRRPACSGGRTDRRRSESARAGCCACSTSRAMCARVLSAAGRRASTSMRPRAVDAAGKHFVARRPCRPATDSPVIGAWFTVDSPRTTHAIDRHALARADDRRCRPDGRPPRRIDVAPRRRDARAPRPAPGSSASESRAGRASMLRASSHCATLNSQTTTAASGQSPRAPAPDRGDHHQHVDVEHARAQRSERARRRA